MTVGLRRAPGNQRLVIKQAGSRAYCPYWGNFWSVFLGSFSALSEAIAFAIHFQDGDVVCQPIKQCTGEAFGSEGLGPLPEGQIAGDQG